MDKGFYKKIANLLYQLIVPITVLYILLIIVGSLWPRLSRHYQTGEVSLGLIPQEGDNFKIANDPAVYRLEKGKRRQYKSDTSFFNHSNNKPFDTPYEEGGILICDKAVVLAFPMGDYMPKEEGGIGEVYLRKKAWERFQEALFRRDKVKHCVAYAIFAMLLLLLFRRYTQWSTTIQGLVVLVLGTLLGEGIEWLQYLYIPGRDKELLDLAFNTLGLFAGYIIYQQLTPYWEQLLEE